MKLQLDTGSDITIVTFHKRLGKKLGKPSLLAWRKVVCGVSGRTLNFLGKFVCNFSFVEKTKKSLVLVLKNTTNLLPSCIALFNLWDLPINSFSNQVKTATYYGKKKKIKTELKRKFPEVFSECLGTCTKAKAKFKVKENAEPEFKLKRSVPFAAFDSINKKMERLENVGIISKVNHSKWALPTVNVKKRIRKSAYVPIF